MILLISALQVAWITDVSYHACLKERYFSLEIQKGKFRLLRTHTLKKETEIVYVPFQILEYQ
jgi:hypothetical protein